MGASKPSGVGARFSAALLAASCLLAGSLVARAEEEAKRPEIRTNRWQEDWSALADPALRTEPLDAIKYIPIMPGDPKSYMSFGMTLRERFESVNAAAFGTSGNKPDNYLIQRLQFHAEIGISRRWARPA
jgi:hypothetical protein